jgi:hypothetical protein
MQNAYTLYMDLSNLVSIQIQFKLFTARYPKVDIHTN